MIKHEHSTKGQLIGALRDRYKTAEGVKAARIAKWVDANCTDAEIEKAFAASKGQEMAALKGKLKSDAAALDAIKSVRGE